MKLSVIEKEHILKAASEMDDEADNSWAEYWVQLDNGKEYQFKRLTRRAYEIATGEKIDADFFGSNDSYRSFIENKFGYKVVFKVPDNIPFFKTESIEFFSAYAGGPYRTGNEEMEAAGRKIRAEIFKKTNVWGRLLNLDNWEVELDNRWQLSGSFKPYSWVRIFKPKDKNAKVFFTIGVDGKNSLLFYKLDCQRKQYTNENALSSRQVEIFDRIIIGTGAEWNKILLPEIIKFNWESLRQLTINFIEKYESLYDEAIEALQSVAELAVSVDKEESLMEFPMPRIAFDSLPTKKYRFKGVIVDYDAENINSKNIGSGGEELVLEKEKEFLMANGLQDLIDEVIKVKDGEGYDIVSFDLNRNKKYIEVKTTTGINTRPFIMTDNEWEFMRKFSDQYYLYRIYDYDKELKRGNLFCISGNIEEMVFTRPKQIEVFLKSRNNK